METINTPQSKSVPGLGHSPVIILFAKFFSYIFHPLFIPLYVTWYLVFVHQSFFAGFGESAKNGIIRMVSLNI